MASEDSDQLMPGLPAIHRLNNLRDLHKTINSQVATRRNELDAVCELCEIVFLRCPQRIRAEEGNDRFEKIISSLHVVPIQMLPMVVVPPVDSDAADTKEALQLVQTRQTARALHHDELV
jgi:hypothetical protein